MKRKIAVICALASEAEKIVSALSDAEREKAGVMDLVRGTLGDTEVLVARCGAGKVFAAMCAETVILSFGPQAILNSGVAGSCDRRLSVGDLCVGTSFVQHDFDTTAIGDPPYFIAGGIDKSVLPGDETIAGELMELAEKEGVRAFKGLVATGDRFIAKKEEKLRLGTQLSALVCEMEAAAMAQVACAHGIPFVAIRAVADSLTDDSAVEYAAFTRLAAERSARVILGYLRK